MSALIRLFLSGSLKTHKIDGNGRPDENGLSDLDVLNWFHSAIQRAAGSRVDVIVTKDPINESISAEVQRSISQSDVMLCIFTKRSEDRFLHNWTTSPYVLSESGFGAARLPRARSPRMLAFVEEGVDRNQLGLAFPADDRVLPVFRRDNLAASESKLREIIDRLIKAKPPEHRTVEPLTLRKTVTVWRSGWVLVESFYSYQVRRIDYDKLRIPHTLWRISRPLPTLREMRRARSTCAIESGSASPFLHCIPFPRDNNRPPHVRYKLEEKGVSHKQNELSFDLVFQDLHLEGEGMLEYLLMWAYPQAFTAPAFLKGGNPNSVGLRTGERGTVADATLVLKFERDWPETDEFRSVEEDPRWFVNNDNDIPATADPISYWHDKRNWPEEGRMFRQQDVADGRFDVFVWNRSSFNGQLKVIWNPGENYHLCDTDEVASSAAVDTQDTGRVSKHE